MTTTTGVAPIIVTETITTAGLTQPTLTTSVVAPVMTPSDSARESLDQAGSSHRTSHTPLAEQIEDLNFYLRRMSLSGNGDISQIDSYGGGPDYEMFLDAVSSVGVHYGWTEAQTLRTIEMKLKDKAREYYGALLAVERPTTMVEMRNWFRRVFGRRLTISAGKRELELCVRHPGEPLGEYAQRLKIVANKMFPSSSLTSRERLYHRNLLLVNQFVEGLEGRLANEVLRAGEFYNLDDCLEVAENCEEIVSRMIPETRYDRRMATIRRVEANTEELSTREVTPYTQDCYQSTHHQRDHQARRPRQEEGGNFSQDHEFQPNVQRAAFPGHMRGTGRRRPQIGRHGNRVNYTRSAPIFERFSYMRNRCIRCGEEGHISTRCTNNRKLFCFHCGKIGEVCSLNSQRPASQPPN